MESFSGRIGMVSLNSALCIEMLILPQVTVLKVDHIFDSNPQESFEYLLDERHFDRII